MNTQVIAAETTAVGQENILSVIARAASDPSVDVQKMSALLDMQERVVRYQAEIAFKAAFAAMQAELPEIPRNGEIKVKGVVQSKYALLEDMQELCLPIMRTHGFSIGFEIVGSDHAITVTAILSHKDGYERRTGIPLPFDTSGNKNTVQAHVSAVSYGKRTTMGAILGVRSRGEDDDGQGTGKPQGKFITPLQREAIVNALGGPGERVAKFCAAHNLTSLDELSAESFDTAIAQIRKANEKRG